MVPRKDRVERRRPRNAARTTTDTTNLKVVGVVVFFAVLWVLLWGRAAYVQLVLGPKLSAAAGRQTLATEFERGERGRIFSSNNALLATSVESKSIYATPVEVTHVAATAQTLSRILRIPLRGLVRDLSSKRGFVWVKRQIADVEAEAIQKAKLPGIHLTTEYRRMYPNRSLAGQVLGFVDVDGKGLEGIEAMYDERMAGGRAHFVVQRDAAGRRLYLDAQGRPTNIRGQDVRLTINTVVQDAAEQALAEAVNKYHGRSGIAIVVRTDTGEILALAHYPFFNCNEPGETKPSARRDRAATDIYEPGSVMKPFLFATALEDKAVDTSRVIYCENGRWVLHGRAIRDTHPHGWLSIDRILRYSSNIGTAKIGLALGAQPYYDALRRLGFGERPGLGLPNESPGLLRPAKDWHEFGLANIAFGQGIGVTALQMVKGYLALANHGVGIPLKLVLDPQPANLPAPRRIFSRRTADTVLAMMREVVQDDDGTGKLARIPGIVMAGKTGTAQKASRGGYGRGIVASFAGLVPGDNPKFLFMVTVDEPKPINYGGIVCAPAVREIALKTLSYYGLLPAGEGAPDTPEYSLQERATRPPQQESDGSGVPDLVGLSVRRALDVLGRHGIVPTLRGSGMFIIAQKPGRGAAWPKGRNAGGEDAFILWLGQSQKEQKE